MPIKIVLVEDSDTIQTAAKMVMHSEREYELLGIKSLSGLSENLESLRPDLVIIDKHLLDQSASKPAFTQPVIYLIGQSTTLPSAAEKVSYLKKPFDSQTFLRAIQIALSAEQAPAKVSAPLPPMETLRPAAPARMAAPTELGLSKDELREMARKIIEEVAWEVVPELAESIIREEIRRLTKE